MVEPDRHIGPLGGDFVLSVEVIQRRGEVRTGAVLKRRLAVDALAVHIRKTVVDVLRRRVDVVWPGTVGNLCVTWRLGQSSPVVFSPQISPAPPTCRTDLCIPGISFLIATRQRDTERVVRKGVGIDTGDFGGDFLVAKTCNRVVVNAFSASRIP